MVLAILQARMSSTRLPGKVLRPILGEPMLARQIERLRRAKSLSRIVVATSTSAEDDAIVACCRELEIDCLRGPLDDVLTRFLIVIDACAPVEQVVRLTADCPLADPTLIDRAVAAHLEACADYTTTNVGWTFPKGLDVEIVRAAVLREIDGEARGEEREHVTAFIYGSRAKGRYRLNAVTRDPPLRYRWTVDTPEDFAFVSAVYAALYPANAAFTTDDVLGWQALHPEQVLINEALG